jgi:tetratricopeptide (TPR) repeat protein
LANLFELQQRWNDAELQIRRALELAPKELGPRVTLARYYLSRGNKENAEQTVAEAKQALNAYRMLGDFYLSLGDYDRALAEFDVAVQNHPKDLKLKKDYIQLLIARGKINQASKLTDETLKENSHDFEALVARGEILNRENKPREAIATLKTILSSEPGNVLARYELGVALNATGDVAGAESTWREAVQRNPDLPQLHEVLGQLAMRKFDAALLASSAENLIRLQPASPLGYVYRAAVEVKSKNLKAAEQDLAKSIEVAPQNPIGYTRMGALRTLQNNYSAASQYYDKALQLNPGYLEALEGLVAVDVRQNRLPAAIDRVREQIARVPDNSRYYQLLSGLFAMDKDMANAEAAMQKAADMGNPEALLQLGVLQTTRGDSDRALANYRRLVQQKPNDIRGYVMLASLLEAREDYPQAQELYEKALQVSPDNPVVANNLAYLMLQHGGNLAVATSLAQVARRGMPNSVYSADTLAWAYYHTGDYFLAVDLLRQATTDAPENATYQYHLGLAYEKINDKRHAREHLERALQIDPKNARNEEIRTALEQLGRG